MIVDLIAYLAFIAMLAIASVTDVKRLTISNKLILVMVAVWFAWQIVRDIVGARPVNSVECILAALIIGGGMLLFTMAYEALTKKYSMGGGDIKLIAVCALYLGLGRGLICLLVACIASIFVALIYPRTRFGKQNDAPTKAMPFAPAIAIGAIVTMFI